jgi:Family of unknown function (DUF6496)
MPEKKTLERARRDRREGRAPSTQAGEFIREQIEHIRKGKHGARSTKQAIAIGLSEARRAGVDLPPPAKGKTSERTRKSAARAYALGHGAPPRRAATPKRARASKAALEREGHEAASHDALAAQARRRAGAQRRPGAHSPRTVDCSDEGRQNQGPDSALGGGSKGRTHAQFEGEQGSAYASMRAFPECGTER